jgi:hypothetical protein
VPDFDPIALAPGAGVFTLLTYLIVKFMLQASADRRDYAARITEHHQAHRDEIAALETKYARQLVECEAEKRAARQEIEAARKARWEAEDARWRNRFGGGDEDVR